MKIVVIGGSGLIGRKLVDRLSQHGHEAMAASPASGVDTITGQRLAEALTGAQVVVDVANSPSFQDEAVARLCAMVYFLFFLMPWYTARDKVEPVPKWVPA